MTRGIVLFDLDGTLTDSEAGVISSFRHALYCFGLDADDFAIREWIGPPLHEGLRALGVPSAEVAVAVEVYREFFAHTGMFENRLFDGVTDMLAQLRDAGFTMGVATSKLQRFADAIVEHFDIAGMFSVICGAGSSETRVAKDHIVGSALNSLGSPDPAGVALVGDRRDDMRAAIEHRIRPVGAGWGYGSLGELERSGAQVIVDAPSGIPGVLLGSDSWAASGDAAALAGGFPCEGQS